MAQLLIIYRISKLCHFLEIWMTSLHLDFNLPRRLRHLPMKNKKGTMSSLSFILALISHRSWSNCQCFFLCNIEFIFGIGPIYCSCDVTTHIRNLGNRWCWCTNKKKNMWLTCWTVVFNCIHERAHTHTFPHTKTSRNYNQWECIPPCPLHTVIYPPSMRTIHFHL